MGKVVHAVQRVRTHWRDLIDPDVVLQVGDEVPVAPGPLIMLADDERDGAQHIRPERQVEEHVDGRPDSLRRVGS